MKILAIDSSGLTATAAVYIDGVIVACQSVNNKKTHSQTLLPMINDVIEQADITPDDLDAVAVAEGPGSFTGLRIGAATVKGLCLAIDKPVIPVSTLKGLAYNMAGSKSIVCPIMDARRRQVYTAAYIYEDGHLNECLSGRAVAIEELLDKLEGLSCGESVTFVGDGIPVHREYISERLGERAHFAPPHLMYQNSASIAVLAAGKAEQGLMISADEFEPVYLRLSQAEREKLEREHKVGQ